VVLANRAGRIIERKRLTRRQFERFVDGLPAGTDVIMEACWTAHYWGRQGQSRDLLVRLLPPQYARPYVRRNKTDRTDSEALLEAARCGGVQPVPVKTVEQQTLQALHRVRTQWQAARTARINVVRGLLREQGLPIPMGARTVLARVPGILEDADLALPDLLRQTLALVVDEIRALDARITTIDRQLARVAAEHPVAQRLQQIPGVGVLTATALVGAVNHIHAFRRGREFASWLGLTPRESSNGRSPIFRRHEQTRRRVPPVLTHAWCSRRPLDGPTPGANGASPVDAVATMGGDDGRTTGPQQGRDRPGQQDGPDHLGRLAPRDRFSRAAGHHDRRITKTEYLPDEMLSEDS